MAGREDEVTFTRRALHLKHPNLLFLWFSRGGLLLVAALSASFITGPSQARLEVVQSVARLEGERATVHRSDSLRGFGIG